MEFAVLWKIPALHDRFGLRFANVWQTNIKPKPQIIERRNLPENSKLICRRLSHIEISGAQFMGHCG